jgi:drug/metabolite transporter (DMT)-like permease
MSAKHVKTPSSRRRVKKPKTPLFAILLIVLCTLLTSGGQLLLKMGTAKLDLSIAGFIQNFPLLLGCILYGLGAIIMIIALKYGELSVLAPIIALSFIWVMFLSTFFLHEHVSPLNWIGVIFILFGVSCIGRGGSM